MNKIKTSDTGVETVKCSPFHSKETACEIFGNCAAMITIVVPSY